MSDSSLNSDDPNLDVLRRFLDELHAATDPAKVVAEYCVEHPGLADQIRGMAAIDAVLQEKTPTWSAHLGGGGAPGSAVVEGECLGPYRIIRVIAHGGMGEVFEATEETLDRCVAVKTIRRGRNTRPDWMQRFLHEREVLAQLHHTHIVPIFAAGQEGDLLYFAMPYIRGASLGEVIRTARSSELRTPGHMSSTFEDLVAKARSGGEKAEPHEAPAELWPARKTAAAALDLSTQYIRSTVEMMAAVAEALHHAHEARVIHRDLKPSNIMVEPNGHPWVLDFGLARVRHDPDGTAQGGAPALRDRVAVTVGHVGTPPYMAPEQYTPGREVDARTDVWGLGVTLYELLTLHQAFQGRESVLGSDPVTPREYVRTLPQDLEAIVLKALKKDPAGRYQSALDLSEDLRRWLRGEPVAARPALAPRRATLWARRNKGWAVAIGCATAALLGGIVAAVATERFQRREALLQQSQRIRLTPHAIGWSYDTWKLARDASHAGRTPEVQDEAAATLAGLDARSVKTIDSAGLLGFDPRTGHMLLVSQEGQVRDWDPETYQEHDLGPGGDGVLAFRADGRPVLFGVQRDAPSLALRDIRAGRVLQRFTVPVEGDFKIRGLSVSPDAACAAASVHTTGGERDLVAAWDTATGRLLKSFPVRQPTHVAFTPDGKTLAVGDEDGVLRVWSLHDGRALMTLTSGPTRVMSLAFAPDPTRPAGSGEHLLAAGDSGGVVTIWDLRLRVPRCYCRGAMQGVTLLAFSPDALTLATTGRGAIRLWDTSTGNLLLSIPFGNTESALAFSPDGRRIASSRFGIFGDRPGVEVWELDNGRGVATLRGLRGPVERVVLSGDGSRAAALTHEWQVGAWDLKTGRLLAILDPPRGDFVDSVDLAFSPDGRRLAVSAGHEARLFDLTSGKLIKTWALPEALGNRVSFQADDRLVLIRQETADPKLRPYIPGAGRVVVRVRDLLGPEPTRPIAEITDGDRDDEWVQNLTLTPDGSLAVIESLYRGKKPHLRLVRAYETRTGKNVWDLPNPLEPVDKFSSQVMFDPTGSVLSFSTSPDPPRRFVLGMPDRTFLYRTEGVALGAEGKLWADYSDEPPALTLKEPGRPAPLVRFLTSPDSLPGAGTIRFSRDGRRVVWGNPDGTVTSCDLAAVQKRLAEIGLGW